MTNITTKETTELVTIPENAIVTLKSTPYRDEVIYSKTQSTPIPCTKINATQYIDERTGEICDYNKPLTKTMKSFQKQMKEASIIMRNFEAFPNSVFITLKYFNEKIDYNNFAQYMDSFDRIPKDFEKFKDKLERRYGKILYFYIKEPHDNGIFHLHCIIARLDNQPLNITQDKLNALWKKGETYIEPLYNIHGLTNYFDISKNHKKTHRLKFYPTERQIYGNSRILSPRKSKGSYNEIKKKLKNKKMVYTKTIEVFENWGNESQNKINDITYEQFVPVELLNSSHKPSMQHNKML